MSTAPTVSQGVIAFGTSNVTATLPTGATAGSTLVAHVVAGLSFTDLAGWTKTVGKTSGTAIANTYTKTAAGGETAVTVTGTGGDTLQLGLAEVVGAVAGSTLSAGWEDNVYSGTPTWLVTGSGTGDVCGPYPSATLAQGKIGVLVGMTAYRGLTGGTWTLAVPNVRSNVATGQPTGNPTGMPYPAEPGPCRPVAYNQTTGLAGVLVANERCFIPGTYGQSSRWGNLGGASQPLATYALHIMVMLEQPAPSGTCTLNVPSVYGEQYAPTCFVNRSNKIFCAPYKLGTGTGVSAANAKAWAPTVFTGAQAGDTVIMLSGYGTYPVLTLTCTAATGNGTDVTFTTPKAHGLKVGSVVTTSAFTPSTFNVVEASVTAAGSATTFTIHTAVSGTPTVLGKAISGPAAASVRVAGQNTAGASTKVLIKGTRDAPIPQTGGDAGQSVFVWDGVNPSGSLYMGFTDVMTRGVARFFSQASSVELALATVEFTRCRGSNVQGWSNQNGGFGMCVDRSYEDFLLVGFSANVDRGYGSVRARSFLVDGRNTYTTADSPGGIHAWDTPIAVHQTSPNDDKFKCSVDLDLVVISGCAGTPANGDYPQGDGVVLEEPAKPMRMKRIWVTATADGGFDVKAGGRVEESILVDCAYCARNHRDVSAFELVRSMVGSPERQAVAIVPWVVSNAAADGATATLNLASNPGLKVGQPIWVGGIGAPFDGAWVTATGTSARVIKFTLAQTVSQFNTPTGVLTTTAKTWSGVYQASGFVMAKSSMAIVKRTQDQMPVAYGTSAAEAGSSTAHWDPPSTGHFISVDAVESSPAGMPARYVTQGGSTVTEFRTRKSVKVAPAG